MRNDIRVLHADGSPLRWTPDNERGKETNGEPTRAIRLMCANAGSPTGHESYGDGTPIVVYALITQYKDEAAVSEGRRELAG